MVRGCLFWEGKNHRLTSVLPVPVVELLYYLKVVILSCPLYWVRLQTFRGPQIPVPDVIKSEESQARTVPFSFKQKQLPVR